MCMFVCLCTYRHAHSAGISGFVLGLQRFFLLLSVWVYPIVTSRLAPLGPLESLECPSGMELHWKQLSTSAHLLTWVTDLQAAQRARQNKGVVTWGRKVVFTHCYFLRDQMLSIREPIKEGVFATFFAQTKTLKSTFALLELIRPLPGVDFIALRSFLFLNYIV